MFYRADSVLSYEIYDPNIKKLKLGDNQHSFTFSVFGYFYLPLRIFLLRLFIPLTPHIQGSINLLNYGKQSIISIPSFIQEQFLNCTYSKTHRCCCYFQEGLSRIQISLKIFFLIPARIKILQNIVYIEYLQLLTVESIFYWRYSTLQKIS